MFPVKLPAKSAGLTKAPAMKFPPGDTIGVADTGAIVVDDCPGARFRCPSEPKWYNVGQTSTLATEDAAVGGLPQIRRGSEPTPCPNSELNDRVSSDDMACPRTTRSHARSRRAVTGLNRPYQLATLVSRLEVLQSSWAINDLSRVE